VRTSPMMRIVCMALMAWATPFGALAQTAGGQAAVIWIAMQGRSQLKRTAPGTRLEGKLARSVYWRDTEVFPHLFFFPRRHGKVALLPLAEERLRAQ